MNDITPKEANEILSHYTDLGYGIVIEGDDTSKIKQALSLASKTLENGTPITEGDLIMFRTLMTEIANKGLTFEEVLLLIDNAKTPTEGDCISREGIRKALNEAFDCEDATKYGNKNAEQQSKSYSTLMLYEIANIVEDCCDNAPPVEPERPTGKWELNGMIYYCSECGHDCGESGDNFCGNCGADMRGGATNEKD